MSNAPVTSVTDELIAELEQLATKATPGPWWIDSHGHSMVSESMDHQLVFTADNRMGKAERNKETGNLSHWPNDWDASFIATANPANILALLAEREELKRDAARYRWLRESMWYADPDTCEPTEGGGMDGYCNENFQAENLDAAIDAAMKS